MSPLLLLCAAALVQGGSADKFMPAAGGEIKYGRAMGTPAYCCPEILEETSVIRSLPGKRGNVAINVGPGPAYQLPDERACTNADTGFMCLYCM